MSEPGKRRRVELSSEELNNERHHASFPAHAMHRLVEEHFPRVISSLILEYSMRTFWPRIVRSTDCNQETVFHWTENGDALLLWICNCDISWTDELEERFQLELVDMEKKDEQLYNDGFPPRVECISTRRNSSDGWDLELIPIHVPVPNTDIFGLDRHESAFEAEVSPLCKYDKK